MGNTAFGGVIAGLSSVGYHSARASRWKYMAAAPTAKHRRMGRRYLKNRLISMVFIGYMHHTANSVPLAITKKAPPNGKAQIFLGSASFLHPPPSVFGMVLLGNLLSCGLLGSLSLNGDVLLTYDNLTLLHRRSCINSCAHLVSADSCGLLGLGERDY